MPGKRSAGAFDEFLSRIGQALGCVTPAPLAHGGHRTDAGPRVIRFLGTDTARLRGSHGLSLQFTLGYQVASGRGQGGPRVEILGYIYQLFTADGTRFLGYHWHPDVDGRPPHLHLYVRTPPELGLPELELPHKHLTTGYISPATFVRFLIAEGLAEPLRDDWQSILDRSD